MRKYSGIIGILSLATLCAIWVSPSGAADEVLSGNIREADNKTGQNTNVGTGIKTNHLQNGAVTSVKIKDGNVANADLANSAVTSTKIKDGSILAADLADGVVTATKIGFYSRVIIVDANGGGDFTSPVAAMSAVATMIPPPSADAPVLLRIMPGVYDVGATTVPMQPFVDIEGSGEGTTRVTGSVPNYGGIVRGASAAQIRFVTLENISDDIRPVGFSVPPGTTPSLLHVTVRATSSQQAGGGAYSFGVYCGIDSAPTLSHVTAIASGGDRTAGIYSDNAAPRLEDVEATGRDGSGFNIGVSLTASDAAVLRRVIATASGAGGSSVGNVGIYNGNSSPVIVDTTAVASGHNFLNIGLRNEGECRPELTNVTARGLGGVAVGMDHWVQGDGQIVGEFEVTADRCTFEGASYSVRNDLEFKVTIGASKLLGGAAFAGGGTLVCLSSYSAAANLTSACAAP